MFGESVRESSERCLGNHPALPKPYFRTNGCKQTRDDEMLPWKVERSVTLSDKQLRSQYQIACSFVKTKYLQICDGRNQNKLGL